MIVERCYDVDTIREILTHPDIYARIAEDGSPSQEDYIPEMIGVAYILGIVDSEPAALMTYYPVSTITWECHVQVMPKYRKTHADEFAQKALQWAWDMGCHKLMATIPVIYPTVKDFGLKHGFEIEGISKQSYLKNGQILDQWYLGKVRS